MYRITDEHSICETAVWSTFFLLNVSTALKGTHNYIFIDILDCILGIASFDKLPFCHTMVGNSEIVVFVCLFFGFGVSLTGEKYRPLKLATPYFFAKLASALERTFTCSRRRKPLRVTAFIMDIYGRKFNVSIPNSYQLHHTLKSTQAGETTQIAVR